MIEAVVECLKERIEGLGFFENYRGLTKLICKPVCKDEKLNIWENQIFPVTCNADENSCLKQGCYKPITPGGCSSLAYFEAGDLVERGCHGGKGVLVDYEFNLRLVCWFNLQKLGLGKCQTADKYQLCIVKEMMRQCRLQDPYSGTVKLGTATITKDPQKIFGKYSYFKTIQKDLLYPHDFFAMDWKVKLTINTACITPESMGCEPQEPLQCLPV